MCRRDDPHIIRSLAALRASALARIRPRDGLRRAALLAVVAAGAVLSPMARADELLGYLEANGLDSLAALRVEKLAASAKSRDEKVQLQDRLAELFARMLDGSENADTRERLLARADALTSELATAKGDLLRVSAARTRYRDAARVAELLRAGIGTEDNAAAAAATLAAQAELLLQVGRRAEKRAGDLDKSVDSKQGLARDLLVSEVDAERSLAGQARYLSAWCLLYRGFVAKDRKDTEQAAGMFLDLLGAREGRLDPSEVSEDLCVDEAYANAILGLALAKARASGFSEATRWLALLEGETVYAGTRDALPGWRVVAALEARAFDAARRAFAAVVERPDAANWARVAAARAIEDGPAANGGDAEQLLREAVATLAARRDLRAVRELVARYGDSVLGADASGFVPRYVRAVNLYEESREAVDAAGDDAAALRADELRGRAAMAAEALTEALAAADAGRFEDAGAACRLMRAWSLRWAGRSMDAARAFDECAAAALGSRAEDAARAAIACLDDLRRESVDATERAAAEQEIVTRIEAFLSRFPASERVPELLVRKIAASSEPELEDVDQLLRVKPGSPEWLSSRTQALSALYRAFRGSKLPRGETGRRYSVVLAELPRDANGLPASSTAVARQALEVLLSSEIHDVVVAKQLLDALDRAGEAGVFDIREADEELAYRRLQVAMLADRWADAEIALAPFEKPEATGTWADAALRLAIRAAEVRRRAAKADSPERGAFVSTIVRAGDAILARAGGVQAALAPDAPDARSLSQVARVSLDARVELVKSSADAEQARAGIPVAEALLAASPRDASLLSAAAVLCEAAGDDACAAAHLRALVGGLPARTNAWFEAKVAQMRVLSRLDAVRARAVIDQFRTLYPDLGPEPYRTQIAEIDAAVPEGTGSGRTEDAGGAAGDGGTAGAPPQEGGRA